MNNIRLMSVMTLGLLVSVGGLFADSKTEALKEKFGIGCFDCVKAFIEAQLQLEYGKLGRNETLEVKGYLKGVNEVVGPMMCGDSDAFKRATKEILDTVIVPGLKKDLLK